MTFTRESWNGRMKACRGVGASLTEKEIFLWEQEKAFKCEEKENFGRNEG